MAEWKSTPSPLALPDELRIPIDAIQSVLTLLIALLNVALAILSVVRAFAFGLLDPLVAVLNALINALEGLINDFRQAGVFIHGDWYLVEFPPEKLRGGFRAYQQRMTARLLDANDPNRPNFSPATAGVAVFFYSSAPVTQIGQLIQFIVGIARFFNQEPRGDVLPTVTNVTVGYGFENFSFYSLQPSEAVDPETVDDLGLADIVNLRWEITAPSRLNPRRPAIIPPAKGFLIELSTVQDGLLLAWSRPVRDNTQDGEGSQNRISGFYNDILGNPVRLYGGDDQFSLNGVGWNSAIGPTGVRTGARQAYALTNPSDTTPIPLELLKDGDDYLLQRTFFVPVRLGSRLLLNQKFGAQILKEDMPYEADFEVQGDGSVRVVPGSKRQAETAWARVVAVSDEVESATDWQYAITPVITDDTRLSMTSRISQNDRGIPSQAVQISFPSETTTNYMRAIETALAVLLLSRSDLPTDVRGRRDPKVSKETGLELAAEVFTAQVAGTVGPNRYFKRKTKAENFRRNFRRRLRDTANTIYRNSGRLPESFKAQVVEFVEEDLLDWKWSDSEALDASDTDLVPNATIIESLESPFQEGTQGVCRNYNSIGVWSRSEDEQVARQIQTRATSRGFGMKDAISRSDFTDTELADSIPIMFGAEEQTEKSPQTSALTTGKIWTCRELFDDSVYEKAEYVLRVAGAPAEPVEGGWIAFRLIPQGIPAIERIFSEVIEWAETFKQGIKGLVDAILEYISFLEARISELQELLLRLRSYLDFANGIYVPQGAVLVVSGEGTEGILNEFLAAENEPQDLALDYGGGAVLVAGGLPDIVFGLIETVLGGPVET